MKKEQRSALRKQRREAQSRQRELNLGLVPSPQTTNKQTTSPHRAAKSPTTRRQDRTQKGSDRQRSSPFRAAWGVVVVVSTVLGLLAIYSLFPKLSFEPSPGAQRTNFFTAEFLLKNQGMFSVHDLLYEMRVRNLVWPGDNRILESQESYIKAIPRLEPDEPTTIVVGGTLARGAAFRGQPIRGEITVVISFRPSFSPLRRTKTFRFMCEKRGDNLAWFPKSRSEK